MSRPIEATPTLRGEDARRLAAQVEKTEVSEDKRAYLEKCDATFKKHLPRPE